MNSRLSTKKLAAIFGVSLLLIILLGLGGWTYYQKDQINDQILTLEAEKSMLRKVLEAAEKEKIAPQLEEKLIEESQPTPEPAPKLDTTTDPEPVPNPDPIPTPPPSAGNWWDYPSVIAEIPLSGVSTQSVVDKGNKLPSTYAPTDLVQLTTMPGLRVNKTLYVRSIIVEPLRQLGAAAQSAGIDLSAISAYRSYQTQQSTYQYWVNYNGGSVAAADQVSARPGHSEHQLGTVVDFSSSEIGDAIGSIFHNTNAAAWLATNAPTYGFRLSYPQGQETTTGYAYESWHWRYWGN